MDIIFYTLNAMIKVKIIKNLNLQLVVNNKSCYVIELAIITLFAFYNLIA